MENALRSLEAAPKLRSKSFVLLWVATVVSSLSMSMFMFLQSWYVVEGLGLEAALGIVLISLSVPRIVFMMIGGVLSDQKDQSRIMFFSDITRAVLCIGLALLFLFLNDVPIWMLALNAAIFGILGGLFEPARDSILPMVVEKEQLTRANSMIQGAMQVALFGGPLLAGLLLTFLSYSTLFFVISMGLLIAGVGILFVKVEKQMVSETGVKQFGKQLKEGFRYLWKSSLLKALFIIAIIVNFFISGPLMMGLPIFVEGILEGGAKDFSYVQGGLTLGMVLGSVLMGMLNLRTKRGRYALILIAFQGAGVFAFSLTQGIWAAIAVIIIVGVLNPAINIPLISMIQAHTEQNKIGRVMSLIRTASFGLIPLSYAATSVIIGLGVRIDTIMAWSAVPLIVSVVILFFAFPVLRTVD